eukprot:2525919-Pyramimonas_sp.AAC.1
MFLIVSLHLHLSSAYFRRTEGILGPRVSVSKTARGFKSRVSGSQGPGSQGPGPRAVPSPGSPGSPGSKGPGIPEAEASFKTAQGLQRSAQDYIAPGQAA